MRSGTAGADALKENVAVSDENAGQHIGAEVRGIDWKINDFPARFALEMTVIGNVEIIANLVLLNGKLAEYPRL